MTPTFSVRPHYDETGATAFAVRVHDETGAHSTIADGLSEIDADLLKLKFELTLSQFLTERAERMAQAESPVVAALREIATALKSGAHAKAIAQQIIDTPLRFPDKIAVTPFPDLVDLEKE